MSRLLIRSDASQRQQALAKAAERTSDRHLRVVRHVQTEPAHQPQEQPDRLAPRRYQPREA